MTRWCDDRSNNRQPLSVHPSRQPSFSIVLAGGLVLAVLAESAYAGQATWEQWLFGEGGFRVWQDNWHHNVVSQVKSPLFWFGMCAQAMFFMRFVWQWIVSERRGHSTVPIAFWYFSLLGGLAMFLYAALRPDPVIMLGQAMACVIYVRNLMLIYGQAARRRQAGLPKAKLRSEVSGEENDEKTA